jgi:hypothetical protein
MDEQNDMGVYFLEYACSTKYTIAQRVNHETSTPLILPSLQQLDNYDFA